jgi:hypothetical protein
MKFRRANGFVANASKRRVQPSGEGKFVCYVFSVVNFYFGSFEKAIMNKNRFKICSHWFNVASEEKTLLWQLMSPMDVSISTGVPANKLIQTGKEI